MKIRKFFVINENACTKYKNLGDAKKYWDRGTLLYMHARNIYLLIKLWYYL